MAVKDWRIKDEELSKSKTNAFNKAEKNQRARMGCPVKPMSASREFGKLGEIPTRELSERWRLLPCETRENIYKKR